MNEPISKSNERILSIDVLRGLAMFIILATQIGGAPIFSTFARLFNCPDVVRLKFFNYGAGTGVTVAGIAQPLFLFVVGVVVPFSLSRRLQKSGMGKTIGHIIIRSMVLFLFGLIAGGKILNLQFDKLYYYNNVLEYISIGYLFCSILILTTDVKVQYIVTAVLLLLIWAVYLFIPVPGWEGSRYSTEMNIGIYIDQVVLGQHGHPFKGWTAVLNTIGQICNMLIGVHIGRIIFSNTDKQAKTKSLLLWGAVMLATGLIWGIFFPLIGSSWTSSYALVTCGIGTLLLTSFYYLVDVKGSGKWAFFFIVFGANSIAIYMMAHLFDFRLIGNIIVGGVSSLFSKEAEAFIKAVTAMAIMWLIMYHLYRRKIFFKI